MPYSAEHKQQTRARIVEAARILFNRHGFSDVTINSVMAEAGLTRGGFYSHFKNKDQLFAEAIGSFLQGRGLQWREGFGISSAIQSKEIAQQMIDGYLSTEHLGDLDGQCPMIALPSDIARANPAVQQSYEQLFNAMVNLFENSLNDEIKSRQNALTISALCVGGMVLARTLANQALADEVRNAVHQYASEIASLK